MQLEEFLSRLQNVAKNGKGYKACCPAHEDNNPSLSVDIAEDDRILLKCHTGCSVKDILAALGLKLSDLFSQKSRKIVATYDYKDENGQLLFQSVRFEPKNFRQRRPDGKGGWLWNLDGTRRVLYRLSNILMADTVYVVEGEKDADRLWSLGLPATTNPQGAGKWRDEYNSFLAGETGSDTAR